MPRRSCPVYAKEKSLRRWVTRRLIASEAERLAEESAENDDSFLFYEATAKTKHTAPIRGAVFACDNKKFSSATHLRAAMITFDEMGVESGWSPLPAVIVIVHTGKECKAGKVLSYIDRLARSAHINVVHVGRHNFPSVRGAVDELCEQAELADREELEGRVGGFQPRNRRMPVRYSSRRAKSGSDLEMEFIRLDEASIIGGQDEDEADVRVYSRFLCCWCTQTEH